MAIMDAASPLTLLAPDEPEPVTVIRPGGRSAFFLTCDHAGKRIPRALGDLGLPDAELDRHIAWDIGARAMSELLSARLDATLVAQTYSRLVIDCNRPLHVAASIPELSEETVIPGNRDRAPAEIKARADEIFAPYHARTASELDARATRGQETILVAMHSFTDRYKGVDRPWHVGVLYGRDKRFAALLIDLLRADEDLVVGDNQPYWVDDQTDYGVPVYGEGRGLAHALIEVRQDLIADAAGQRAWAERLAAALTTALTAAQARWRAG